MMKILEFRTRLKFFYQRFQFVIDPAAKFLLAFLTFHMLNKSIGYDARLTKVSIELLLSILCIFTPASVLVLLAVALSIVHVYSASIMLAIIVFLVFIILYCFLFRYAPQYGYAAVAIPLLYTIKLPFAVPILFGLMANPITILPTACGVIVHYMFKIIKEEGVSSVELSLDDALLFYTRIIDKILENKQMILAIGIFSFVIIIVYVIRSLKIEYAFEISIAVGTAATILGFLIGYLKIGISAEIGSMIFGTILSGIIVLVILFLKRILDYTAADNVQFEDDDYYYYVKAIPKIEVSIPKVNVKRINEKAVSDDSYDLEEEVIRVRPDRQKNLRNTTKRSDE